MAKLFRRLAVIALFCPLCAASSFAENAKHSAAPAKLASPLVLIPGPMRGVGSGGPAWYWRLCSPDSIGVHEWRIGFVKELIKPSAPQMSRLDALALASSQAKRAIEAACAKETIRTGLAHLAVMERRVAGLLEAVRIIRPAYENFYSSLDDRQSRLLDALGPSRRGWRW